MRIKTNLSDFDIKGLLLMKYKDKKQRLIAYISKLFNKAKRNYEIHDKDKLLDVQKYLKGAKSQFKIQIDHKNLEYFIKAQKLNQR